jgi:hypothetical protein
MAPQGIWSILFFMRELDWASLFCLSIPPKSENEQRSTFHHSLHGYVEADPPWATPLLIKWLIE